MVCEALFGRDHVTLGKIEFFAFSIRGSSYHVLGGSYTGGRSPNIPERPDLPTSFLDASEIAPQSFL